MRLLLELHKLELTTVLPKISELVAKALKKSKKVKEGHQILEKTLNSGTFNIFNCNLVSE